MTTPRDAIGLSERLRRTTEMMACRCSVPMDLWQDHSTAALEAATQLDALLKERDAQAKALIEANDHAAVAFRCGIGHQFHARDMEARAIEAEQERDALQARVKELEGAQAELFLAVRRLNTELADEMNRALRAEQERDDLKKANISLTDTLRATHSAGLILKQERDGAARDATIRNLPIPSRS